MAWPFFPAISSHAIGVVYLIALERDVLVLGRLAASGADQSIRIDWLPPASPAFVAPRLIWPAFSNSQPRLFERGTRTMQLGLTESLPTIVARRFAAAKDAGHLIFSQTHLEILRPGGVPVRLRKPHLELLSASINSLYGH